MMCVRLASAEVREQLVMKPLSSQCSNCCCDGRPIGCFNLTFGDEAIFRLVRVIGNLVVTRGYS